MLCRCAFCTNYVLKSEACESNWIPSYYSEVEMEEVFAPVCPQCVDKRLEDSEMHEYVLKNGPFRAPNLDDMAAEDLREVTNVMGTLSVYALNKRAAAEYRDKGQSACALVLEETCKVLYQQLPKWARW